MQIIFAFLDDEIEFFLLFCDFEKMRQILNQ